MRKRFELGIENRPVKCFILFPIGRPRPKTQKKKALPPEIRCKARSGIEALRLLEIESKPKRSPRAGNPGARCYFHCLWAEALRLATREALPSAEALPIDKPTGNVLILTNGVSGWAGAKLKAHTEALQSNASKGGSASSEPSNEALRSGRQRFCRLNGWIFYLKKEALCWKRSS